MPTDWKKRFIEKSIKVHGGKYDYSRVEYVNSTTDVCIICPKHGEFLQKPQAHLRGQGCPICANSRRGRSRLTFEEFVERARQIHGDKYTYSKDSYTNATTNTDIICKEHGVFQMLPSRHLSGQGCPKCAGRGLSTDEILSMFRKVHGDKYDYSKVVYHKMHEKVCIKCQKHGEFWQTPSKHLLGAGCPACAAEKRSKERILSKEEFIQKAASIHGNKYDYSNVLYKTSHDEVEIICRKHGPFRQKPYMHLQGHGCPRCGYVISTMEDEIASFIEELGLSVERRNRSILEGKEIDIFIPSLSVGIECDGLKWHTEEFIDKNFHLDKTNKCLEKGIRLIHVFEDEWLFKKDIVKSIIMNAARMDSQRIFARKCEIRKVEDTEERNGFLNSNHIQGDICNGIVASYGLYFNGELVSIMVFGRPRVNLGRKTYDDGEYELLRFCNKTRHSIVGGASRMFKRFIEDFNPNRIISYCDRRYGTGRIYEILGFGMTHISKPNYYYVFGNNRKNRFTFRKDELVKEGFPKEKTEHEIMLERGIYRIYDCGNYVYVWNKPSTLVKYS